jgi:hypothetical protein
VEWEKNEHLQHPLQCRCGTIKGHVSRPELANRVVCYCGSCQAFAHFLGSPADILDREGGSDVIQVLPKNVTFTQGADSLACLRLTDRGLLRWYASCCKTPIGNTLDSSKLSFVGLLHSCLDTAGASIDNSFGGVRARVNTRGALGLPKAKPTGVGRIIWWFVTTVLKARVNGSYRQTPFFNADTGKPRVSPHVLTTAELAGVTALVNSNKNR